MNSSWVPTEIYIPVCTKEPHDYQDVSYVSRWSDAVPHKSLCPPKQPTREVVVKKAPKTDSSPKPPARILSLSSFSSEVNLQMSSRRLIRSLPTRDRTVASPQRPSRSVSFVRPHPSQVQRSRFASAASRIADRVHRKTSRPEPEANIWVARAA